MAYNPNTMSFDMPSTDEVYIQGLPPDTNEAALAEYFGSIGLIKVDKKTRKPKIWLYRDKNTGELKGDGTLTYEDPFTASSAIEWFNGKEWNGSVLAVSLSDRKQDSGRPAFGGGGGMGGGGGRPDFGGGGGGGGGGGYGQGGFAADWLCIQCGNNNFAKRTECNKCKTPRSMAEAVGGGGGTVGGMGGPPAAPPPPPMMGGAGPALGGMAAAGGDMMAQRPAPAGPPPREGDWTCVGCGNNCFSFRNKCNKCGTPKPTTAKAGAAAAAGGAAGAGGRAKVVAAPQGPPGLFQAGDWACSSCGNMNWAKRGQCNMCNMPKPGTIDTKREGLGGGFKELDEAELEEARKRRKEYEDKDMYDEFGRLKRRFRAGDRAAREAAALARLRGDYDPSPSGQEVLLKAAAAQGRNEEEHRGRGAEEGARDGEDRDRDGEDRERERDGGGEREGGRERERSPAGRADRDGGAREELGEKERRAGREEDREREKDREKDRGREREDRDKDRERERDSRRGDRDREKDRERDRERDREKDKERDKERGRRDDRGDRGDRERRDERQRSRSRSRERARR